MIEFPFFLSGWVCACDLSQTCQEQRGNLKKSPHFVGRCDPGSVSATPLTKLMELMHPISSKDMPQQCGIPSVWQSNSIPLICDAMPCEESFDLSQQDNPHMHDGLWTADMSEARKLPQSRQVSNECGANGARNATIQMGVQSLATNATHQHTHGWRRNAGGARSPPPAINHGSSSMPNSRQTRVVALAKARHKSQHKPCSRHVGQNPELTAQNVNYAAPRASYADRLQLQKERSLVQEPSRPRRHPEGVTTIMIQNVPAQFTIWELLNKSDHQFFKGLYNYYYQPVNYQTKAPKSFAFVNFVSPDIAALFRIRFHGKRLPSSHWEDEPVLVLAAFEQGIEENIVRYFTRKAERDRKEMRSRPIFPEVDFSRIREAEATANEVMASCGLTSPMVDWGLSPGVPPLQDAAWQHHQQTALDVVHGEAFCWCPSMPDTRHNGKLTRACPQSLTVGQTMHI